MIVLDILGILALIALVVIIIKVNKKPDYISLKESLDLTDLPIITFYQKDLKLNFILDTGSTHNVIDRNVKDVIVSPIENTAVEISGLDGNRQTAPNVSIKLEYKNKLYEDEFCVFDMSEAFKKIKDGNGATIHGLIGNSFMQKYKYVLDFDEMVAYSKHK